MNHWGSAEFSYFTRPTDYKWVWHAILKPAARLQTKFPLIEAARISFQEAAHPAARLVALHPDHAGFLKLQARLQTDLDGLNQPDTTRP